jgi:putative protease
MVEAPELLAPAGNWDCVRAAVANGADAVYFGLPRFNARMRADNFGEEEIPEVVRYCRERGVRAYVAFNTLVFTGELHEAERCLRLVEEAGVDALIVQDIGLARLAARVAPSVAIHASTQMTVTSPEGADLVASLGVRRIVLARELSMREIKKFPPGVPLEVFVHGALCVAYSGQCLTSEALGRRSANRGECAQACRMPYTLVVDGEDRDLGDRHHLLSPHDLAAVDDLPSLIELGVRAFKIEGRLKSPEYVAAVTRVYRQAIDAAVAGSPRPASAEDRYDLEMTFSRGFFTGWFHGVNHQRLVSARFGKKRGPFVGRVAAVGRDHVEVASEIPLAPGDGLVFDTGGDTEKEQGGRVYEIRGRRLYFKRDHLDFARVRPGDRVWKTDDPALEARLRRSYAGRIGPRRRERVDLAIAGRAGEPLRVEYRCGERSGAVESGVLLEAARTAPLTRERLVEHLGRFGDAAFCLGECGVSLEGPCILPIGELNRLRRAVVERLEAAGARPARPAEEGLEAMLGAIPAGAADAGPFRLHVLCRTMEQLEAALGEGCLSVRADFEDIRRYRDAVARVREVAGARILLATPRIQKAGESGFFKLIESAEPDGVLVRNLGAIRHFAGGAGGRGGLELVGDFSLNVANPLAAEWFIGLGLDRVTVSYDLHAEEVIALARRAPAGWFELTLHQQMPMFHMEHCVFAAFMSEGTDHTNCGRPCDRHAVRLRDRVGMEHPLKADVGCRNTLFNAVPQTGAAYFGAFAGAGYRDFRVEFVAEPAAETRRAIAAYRRLLAGEVAGETLWRELRALSQVGVTRGTLQG